MGKRTNVALLTAAAGLGFVMMGCPPAEEQPPAGERITEPAPPPSDTTPPVDPMPPPTDPQDPPPLDPSEPEPEPEPYDPPPPGGN